jgi:hypothetical protein
MTTHWTQFKATILHAGFHNDDMTGVIANARPLAQTTASPSEDTRHAASLPSHAGGAVQQLRREPLRPGVSALLLAAAMAALPSLAKAEGDGAGPALPDATYSSPQVAPGGAAPLFATNQGEGTGPAAPNATYAIRSVPLNGGGSLAFEANQGEGSAPPISLTNRSKAVARGTDESGSVL